MTLLVGFFGMPGHVELIILALIILLLFGNRLPNVMRNLGRGVVEFKKGVKGVTEGSDDGDKIEDDKVEDDEKIHQE